MTKPRPAGSIEAALLAALHHLSDAELVGALNKSRAYLYACADPAKREQLHLADAVRLDQALLAKGLPALFLPLMQQAVGTPAAGSVAQVAHGLVKLTKELGDVARAFEEAASDQALSAEERRRLAQEADDVVRQAAQLRDSVQPAPLAPATVPHKGSIS